MSEREAQLESELSELRLESKLLRDKVDALAQMIYGQKSERLDPNQLSLLAKLDSKKAEAPAAVEPTAGAAQKKARPKHNQPRLPDHLPVEETVLDPDEVKAAPDAWRLMGQEVSEQLDYQPARFFKRRLIRRKFARKDMPYQPPLIAPLPPGLQERCLAAPSLIAHVVASKYIDHLPLYRQEQIYRQRHSVTISRQTLCRWTALATDWLEPIYNEMQRQQMRSAYLQVDETPIRYLEPGQGKAPQGYFWVSNVPGGDVIYHWRSGRGANNLNEIVPKSFTGALQCDGYQAYPSFQKQRNELIQLAGCWAHARRKFFEAKERDPKIVGWLLHQITQLYRIEKQLREARAGPTLRAAVRASKSDPILQRLKKAFIKLKPRYLPKSNLGKAIAYALSQWNTLEVFISNGMIEIDNNLVENAIRPSAIGKKNWLFIGSEASGKTSAIIYSIIESAKRHGIDPYAYLKYLLQALPRSTNHQIPSMTPAAYAKRHSKIAA
ncbi:IS66 family transposase [Cerasicoccus maritimus]|uniref:IS66 family transposase n=1 Tax=Cerasicoccus maritimus TaxID=490089 RepID=UPI002852C1E1|nr:IS66 family transposase [Cerasicoccus maritimus]